MLKKYEPNWRNVINERIPSLDMKNLTENSWKHLPRDPSFDILIDTD